MTIPKSSRLALVALLLFGATFALYARTGSFPFVEYDDPAYVRDNPHLAAGLTAETIEWACTSTSYQYNWHPLTWLSHALDLELFGLDAGAHHLVNAGLHALNAALFFLAFLALTGRATASALTAALFALHPLRVESVAWIAERKDVLAGTFFALALMAYARHARAPSRRRMAWVALALAAGLLAKPTLVTVPFVLLLLDVWPLGRLAGVEARATCRAAPCPPRSAGALWREKLPLFVLSLLASVMTLIAQHGGGAFRASIALPERLANAAVGGVTYLRQFLWPFELAVFYPHPALVEPARSHLLAGSAAALALVLLAGAAWRARRRWPWIAVGLLWFLGMLVPMSGLLQVGYLAHADRYAYLSALGLELALAWSVTEGLRSRPRLRLPAAALATGALAALALRTSDQLTHWRDSRTLFEHALAVTEANFVAHNNLGSVLAAAGRVDEGLVHFEAAARLLPGYHEAELNLGRARYQRGEFALARAAFERAVAARPASGAARLFLAAACLRLDDPACARAELAAALEAEPELDGDPRTLQLRAQLAERSHGE